MPGYESMREKCRKESALLFSFFVLLILFIIFDHKVVESLNKIKKDPKAIESYLNLIGIFLVPLLFYIFNILTVARKDFFYFIDDVMFKKRKMIDSFICEEMLNFKGTLNAKEKDIINNYKKDKEKDKYKKSKLLMALFYRYIEKNDIGTPSLKDHAFIYWGDYFNKITFILLGSLFVIAGSMALVFKNSIPLLYWHFGILIIILLWIAENLWSILKGKISKRLVAIPKEQIKQIYRNDNGELLAELRKEKFNI